MVKEIDFMKTAVLLIIGFIGGSILGAFLPWTGLFPDTILWSPVLGVFVALLLGFKQYFE